MFFFSCTADSCTHHPHQKKYLCVRNDSGVRSRALLTAEAVGEATELNSDEQSDDICT